MAMTPSIVSYANSNREIQGMCREGGYDEGRDGGTNEEGSGSKKMLDGL
jgi:hypothetical protein